MTETKRERPEERTRLSAQKWEELSAKGGLFNSVSVEERVEWNAGLSVTARLQWPPDRSQHSAASGGPVNWPGGPPSLPFSSWICSGLWQGWWVVWYTGGYLWDIFVHGSIFSKKWFTCVQGCQGGASCSGRNTGTALYSKQSNIIATANCLIQDTRRSRLFSATLNSEICNIALLQRKLFAKDLVLELIPVHGWRN